MPKGRVPKREAKKPKKKASKAISVVPLSDSTSPQVVEVVGKRKKSRDSEA
jgi:hypothetical protein